MGKMIEVKKRLDQQFSEFQEVFLEETDKTDRAMNVLDARIQELEKAARLYRAEIDDLFKVMHPSIWMRITAVMRGILSWFSSPKA